MREWIIRFLKHHALFVSWLWLFARHLLRIWGWFVPIRQKTMLFCSFGGRNFDDSPKAIYNEVCQRKEFEGWELIWAFVNPDEFEIPRGKKIKIDTVAFFHSLLYSKVMVSNSGMNRGVGLRRKGTVRVETWHGTPLKKICGEENQTGFSNHRKKRREKDSETIRCAQSAYDQEIFERIFHAEKSAILLCDLPRNDALCQFVADEKNRIKDGLGIAREKKVILYAPTYREYATDITKNTPPIDVNKWESMLGNSYVLLIRAHYVVAKAMSIKESSFVKNVSEYPSLNDLYAISDLLISDYSSVYFDYSILDRPILCFAYDRKEYEEKRGLYLNLDKVLPCPVDYDEDALLNHIKNMNYDEACARTKAFHECYAPHAGNASKKVVDEILRKL